MPGGWIVSRCHHKLDQKDLFTIWDRVSGGGGDGGGGDNGGDGWFNGLGPG